MASRLHDVMTYLIGIITILPLSYAVNSARLFIIGDMGGIDYSPYSTYFERSAAKEMGTLAQLYSPQAVLELGDNFYYDGVENVHDSRFSTTYESVYKDESLYVPWYVIAGNHDHHRNVAAQIEYSNYSARWNFPDYFYYKEFPIGDSNQVVGIAFMDTVLLCGDGHDSHKGQIWPRAEKKDKYWDKVKDMLKHSKANYLFGAGHYPVYSVGYHGPTKCLTKDLKPMLEKYNANGYFCGHDHNLQHLKVKGTGENDMDYFVSGMANFVDPGKDNIDAVPKGSLQFFNGDQKTKGGFLYAEATTQNMTFTFISANGAELYTTIVKPRF